MKNVRPSIKYIKHKHYTISDLIHLTVYSHSRKLCQTGKDCVHFQALMKGGFPDSQQTAATTSKNNNNSNNNNVSRKPKSQMYNSLQVPRSGIGKDGINGIEINVINQIYDKNYLLKDVVIQK